MNKTFPLVIIVVLGVIASMYWFWQRESRLAGVLPPQNNESEQVICTADAMQCADGSYVGRTGPNCEFVCAGGVPVASNDPVTLIATLGETVTSMGIRITPQEVVEDSRCPQDVQCIQAGTVRLRLIIASDVDATATSSQIFTLGQPLTLADKVITLTSIEPAKNSTYTITPSQYRFTFTISRAQLQ